jgi:hypothetical protein
VPEPLEGAVADPPPAARYPGEQGREVPEHHDGLHRPGQPELLHQPEGHRQQHHAPRRLQQPEGEGAFRGSARQEARRGPRDAREQPCPRRLGEAGDVSGPDPRRVTGAPGRHAPRCWDVARGPCVPRMRTDRFFRVWAIQVSNL